MKTLGWLRAKLRSRSECDFPQISYLLRDLLDHLPALSQKAVDHELPTAESSCFTLDNLLKYLASVWMPAGQSEYEMMFIHVEELDHIFIITFHRTLSEPALSLSSERRISIVRLDNDRYRCWQYERYDAPFGSGDSEGKYVKPALR